MKGDPIENVEKNMGNNAECPFMWFNTPNPCLGFLP
jgi:hypothetical protein